MTDNLRGREALGSNTATTTRLAFLHRRRSPAHRRHRPAWPQPSSHRHRPSGASKQPRPRQSPGTAGQHRPGLPQRPASPPPACSVVGDLQFSGAGEGVGQKATAGRLTEDPSSHRAWQGGGGGVGFEVGLRVGKIIDVRPHASSGRVKDLPGSERRSGVGMQHPPGHSNSVVQIMMSVK